MEVPGVEGSEASISLKHNIKNLGHRILRKFGKSMNLSQSDINSIHHSLVNGIKKTAKELYKNPKRNYIQVYNKVNFILSYENIRKILII